MLQPWLRRLGSYAHRPALNQSIADLHAEFPAEVGVGLTGRLLHRQNRELVIEIALDGPVDWNPTGAEVVWRDGTRLVASVDARHTTRSGRIAAGLLIRLALRLDRDGPPAAPAAVIVSGGLAPLTVTLQAR